MDYKERLKQYLENDVIYSLYKSGKFDMSDFDKFCVEHCKDIECLLNENEELQQENQELKKQLKECYCNRTDCSGRIKDSKQYDSLVQKVEAQQKEFIGYLEDYIDVLKQQKETVEGLDIGEEHILMILEEVLEKYKEIIGVKNE